MSRLDYITIAIVAACILAIIFLVYKMTDLFNDKPTSDPIETTGGKVEEEDSTYNYNIVDDAVTNGESSSDSGNAAATGEGATKENPTTTSNEEDERTPTSGTTTTTKNPSSTSSSSSGKYMVIAGTFAQKASARRQLQKLKKLGYNNATVEPFDKGKYDVVMVDRFDNMAAAERLVKDLKTEGVDSYVKAKEGNN